MDPFLRGDGASWTAQVRQVPSGQNEVGKAGSGSVGSSRNMYTVGLVVGALVVVIVAGILVVGHNSTKAGGKPTTAPEHCYPNEHDLVRPVDHDQPANRSSVG